MIINKNKSLKIINFSLIFLLLCSQFFFLKTVFAEEKVENIMEDEQYQKVLKEVQENTQPIYNMFKVFVIYVARFVFAGYFLIKAIKNPFTEREELSDALRNILVSIIFIFAGPPLIKMVFDLFENILLGV